METLESILRFLSSYPTWAKALMLAGLAVTAATLVLAPRTSVVGGHAGGNATVGGNAGHGAPAQAVLRILGVDLFPPRSDAEVQVRAFVNGTVFRYPSVGGVEWLKVGPAMSAQTFKLPDADSYDVRFEMTLRTPRGQSMEMVSQSVVTVADTPIEDTYNLHRLEGNTRGANVAADVRFRLEP